MSKNDYIAVVAGKLWGYIIWKKSRILIIDNAGVSRLMHRNVCLRQARESISRQSQAPVDHVKLHRVMINEVVQNLDVVR